MTDFIKMRGITPVADELVEWHTQLFYLFSLDCLGGRLCSVVLGGRWRCWLTVKLYNSLGDCCRFLYLVGVFA